MKNGLYTTSMFFAFLCSIILSVPQAFSQDKWITYTGEKGPGQGKHIVIVTGDDEYRSEESMPQLAKILATQHGFKCTVLFAIDPQSGIIKPDQQDNIPAWKRWNQRFDDYVHPVPRFARSTDEIHC